MATRHYFKLISQSCRLASSQLYKQNSFIYKNAFGISIISAAGSFWTFSNAESPFNSIKLPFSISAIISAAEISNIQNDNKILPPITLYQYEVCPFCCKVRAFLDYHKIPYKVIEVNPLLKSELKWSTYKKVPVVKLGDEQINDSNIIITKLTETLKTQMTTTQNKWRQEEKWIIASDGTEEEEKWRKWVDDRYIKIITANIYRSWNESWQTFNYITEHGNFNTVTRHTARVFGTGIMYVIGRKMPSKYNIEGDLREALYDATGHWMNHIGKNNYAGGKEPNLADLAVFGVLRAIYGTNTWNDIVKNTELLKWYKKMEDVVGESSRLK